MRFDDSLDTVLAADSGSPFGAQSAWRQLVDLIGRRRVPASAAAMERLASIRDRVPAPIRAASSRALAFADPPVELVRLFANEEPAIAAPVLRTAQLNAADWIAMLASMPPANRSLLRLRRDLPDGVARALESFGSTDFVLSGDVAPAIEPATVVDAPPPAPTLLRDNSFTSVASIADALPIVVEAKRKLRDRDASDEPPPASPSASPEPRGPFKISELVARIEAYQRQRDENGPLLPWPDATIFAPVDQDEGFGPAATVLRFETDNKGIVRWVTGVSRAPLIGLSLQLSSLPSGARVDGVAAGAFRCRAPFRDARLVVDGLSDAAGQWRISAVPVFLPDNGRFAGYRGVGRRPRVDEAAEPVSTTTPDLLRQLVHELRTPTTAIAGFAEMIEAEVLGPVPDVYRGYAGTIRSQTMGLLGAIDDIDMAARIEAGVLDLRPGRVAIAPMLARVVRDLQPLCRLRDSTIDLSPPADDLVVDGDNRAVERLLARMLSALVSGANAGERIAIDAATDDQGMIAVAVDRPRAMAAFPSSKLFSIDADAASESEGAPLLGAGFALRLSRNLARQLGGSLSVGDQRLTLRLPAAVSHDMGQASTI